MEKKKFKFSKKLFMAIVSGVLVIANDGLDLGLPTESVIAIAGVAAAYIFGQSVVDKELVANGQKRE